MTSFHSAIRNVLSEVDSFFSETLRLEKVSKKASLHKEKIVDLIFRLRQEYPELLPTVSEFTRNDEDFIPELAARELKTITKAGFLEKRRKKETLFQRGSYQRRYCVIQKGVFYYYVNPTDKKQAGAFNLKGYKFRKAPYLPEDGHKKDLSFELVCPGKRSYQFLAEISQDFQEWKEAISSTFEEKKNMTNTSKSTAKDIDPYEYDDDGDQYYVAVNNDDDIHRSPDNDAENEEGENYELIPSPTQPEPERNGNYQTDRTKPPLLPKKSIPHPPKKSQTTRAPLKPPVLPKHDRALKEVRKEKGGETYVDCESRRPDDDDDDDDDYTEPIDFGRYSDGEFDDEYEVYTAKGEDKPYRKSPDQTESQDLYYADATSGPPRSEVTSDIYQDASSGGPRK